MSDNAADTVHFYFSFRSPYAWIAFHMVPQALSQLPVTVVHHPVFPPAEFIGDPTKNPTKLKYMFEHDLPRLAGKLGMKVQPPTSSDIEWMPPHAMWIHASDQGKGQAFGEAMFRARWCESKDLGDERVCAEAAERAGLDPEATVAAGRDEGLQTRVMEGMLRGVGEGLFGVPYFSFGQHRFWGHDRIAALQEAIRDAYGLGPSVG